MLITRVESPSKHFNDGTDVYFGPSPSGVLLVRSNLFDLRQPQVPKDQKPEEVKDEVIRKGGRRKMEAPVVLRPTYEMIVGYLVAKAIIIGYELPIDESALEDPQDLTRFRGVYFDENSPGNYVFHRRALFDTGYINHGTNDLAGAQVRELSIPR